MEKILTAVPYPMTDGQMDWGIVCADHPTWSGNNEPTDWTRASAEAFAAAVRCNHPDHFGVTVVHVVSATQIVTGDGDHTLAMCGEDMGPYDGILSCHPVGNYLWTDSPLWGIVTCAGCLARRSPRVRES